MPPKKKPPTKKKPCVNCKKLTKELERTQEEQRDCLRTNSEQLQRLSDRGLLEIRIVELESMLDDVIDEKTQLAENCEQIKTQLQKQAQTFGMEAA